MRVCFGDGALIASLAAIGLVAHELLVDGRLR
jgi:hypothetical protein